MSTAFTVMTLLNMIAEPLRSLPLFIGQLIEFQVAMRRIQNFIGIDEINFSMVSHIDRVISTQSIEMFRGNFHWGSKIEDSEAR